MRCSPRSTAGVTWAASELGSSAHAAVGDDGLKDFDNAAWVVELEPSIQPVWLQRIRAIRLADRLAENQQLDPTSRRFDRFVPSVFDGEGPAGLPPSAQEVPPPPPHPPARLPPPPASGPFGVVGRPP